ncbi:hypothetical protein CERZMDRAFT_81441 [Cercospora zeae-maydis SCOH1-5]|uniref:Uncharacterized protein n=1 Tax=Cercospora zeae-maydis SCOH1-5 TaxID=717836 RepID=A0A6A6FS47_9PEZI|nr:hypothetical protein CERZMDRAFT_81441 [Cercospora zeae-maydis SCOH1-5]
MSAANKIEQIFNVNGLVAVITGGGSGLGLYAARALDANGAKAVYIVGRREETLKEAAKTAVNGTIKPIVGDVSDKQSLKKIAQQIQEEQGYINTLFANAGVSGPAHAKAVAGKKSVKEWADALFEPEMSDFTQTAHINNTAAFYTAVAFLELLDAGNKQRNVPQDSQIIVTSSVAGLSRQLASSFAYSTSKAAVTHLVKMLSTAFSQQRFHIRVNSIQPGLYPSEMTAVQIDRLTQHDGIPGHEGAYGGARAMDPKSAPAERTELVAT